MGHCCIRFGISPEIFWNLTPWETNAMASAYAVNQKERHKLQSWFTAHIMVSSGMMKKGTRIRSIIEQLNMPVESCNEMREITSLEQLEKWESDRAKYQESKATTEVDDTTNVVIS